MSGDLVRLVRTLEGLQQERESQPLVLWAMTEEVRALAQVKSGLTAGKPLDVLLKEVRVWGVRQPLFRKALQRVSSDQANAALALAARIDRQIKGAGAGDTWDDFLRIGMLLSGRVPTA